MANLASADFNQLRNAVLLVIATPVTLFLAWVLKGYIEVLRLRSRLPPGPFPLPLFGNHFSIPKSKPWIAFYEWSKYYNNPMLTVWVGRKPYIYLHDATTAIEMLEDRSNIYSDRPKMPVMGDLRGSTGVDQVALGYNDHWRQHRRLMHTAVGVQAVRGHRHVQGNEAKLLLRDFLQTPDNYVNSIERYSVSVVSVVGWGRRIDKIADPIAKTALSFMESVDMIIPGQYMAETIPELCHLPRFIYALPTDINNVGKAIFRFFYALSLEGAEAQEDNFAKRLIKAQNAEGLKNDEIATLTVNLIGGGVDTTSSTMISSILAMAVFQEKQEKAQAELDRVVGRERLPDYEDEKNLPFVSAFVKEVLRWRSVAILAGIPHAPTADDVYRGYFIPKGTSITGNLWGIHRDPNQFPQPDAFVPERFSKDSPHYRQYPNSAGMSPFGFGRRICSGQPLATQGLFLTIARILWCFHVRPGLEADGTESKLDIFAYTDSENMRPQPFKARFTPRFEAVKEMILSEAEEARVELQIYDGETHLGLNQFLQGAGTSW